MALDTSDTLAVTAIVVALIALLSTVGQIVQQYIGTSEGYRRCQPSVMGLWGQATRRKFHFGEMRSEVFFQTPEFVIDTVAGDRRRRAAIDGTIKSYEETRTKLDNEKVMWQRHISSDNEEASWVLLLDVLQHAEKASRQWDQGQRVGSKGIRRKDPQVNYDFSVGIRMKTQSWKFVPAGVTKPFASTTISALVRIVAHLGMHWVAFDQAAGNVVAEGNGLVLTSALIPGLGMIVYFGVTGIPVFQVNRLVPRNEVGTMSFGTVRSILTEYGPDFVLRFGSAQEVSRNLEILGCTHDTISYFERGHQHQFSISFAILGMLGTTFRLRNSGFRRVPNPTKDAWPQEYLFPLVLLDAFANNMDSFRSREQLSDRPELETISKECQKILHAANPSLMSIDIDVLEAVHDAIDDATEMLSFWTDSAILFVVGEHVTNVINSLHDLRSELHSCRKLKKVVLPSKAGMPERRMIMLYLETILPKVQDMSSKSGRKIRRAKLDAGVQIPPDSDGTVLWCILLFRMICWLTLHDFDPEDIQMIPPSLRHSRVPVYIG